MEINTREWRPVACGAVGFMPRSIIGLVFVSPLRVYCFICYYRSD